MVMGHIDAGGERYGIRFLEPRIEDATALRRLFFRLSADSVYRRFMSPVPRPTPELARRLLDLDHWDREALAAFAGDRIVAVVRYARLVTSPDVAEVAIVVEDERQRRGVGRALMARLAAVARRRGIRSFHSTMLGENRTAVRLLRNRFPRSRFWWDGGQLEAESPLRPLARGA